MNGAGWWAARCMWAAHLAVRAVGKQLVQRWRRAALLLQPPEQSGVVGRFDEGPKVLALERGADAGLRARERVQRARARSTFSGRAAVASGDGAAPQPERR